MYIYVYVHVYTYLYTLIIYSLTYQYSFIHTQQEASQRTCTVKVEQGGHLVRVGITFPKHYPNGAAPSFIFDKSTTIDMSVQQDLNRVSRSMTSTMIAHSVL